ncbi:MAG: hypothetical protein QY322_01495 [bacterium]|nr:MAG: hypothetical protein QY322_01495 [bacterium]
MKNYLIVFSILILALVVRLYNFSDRMTFGSEQARSLYVSANYISEKPSLLGQEYFRVNSLGHKLYTSAVFNYSLVPLLLIFDYDPLPISYYFALLNIATGIIMYFVVKKMFSHRLGLICMTLFLFNSYMIYHSMFIWVLNYLPLIGILSIYLLWKIKNKKSNLLDLFILGVLSGLGFGLQYLYVIAILIILYVVFKYSKNKAKDLLVFIVGGVIGDFTQVVFDLKHNLYHLRTLLQYALDTFNGVSDAGFTYYHFLHFWPVVILVAGFLLWKVYLKNKFIFYVLFFGYLYLNLSSNLINFNKPVGMVDGLTNKSIVEASRIISQTDETNFNVVTLYDFDTRGYVLRYYTEFVYDKKPMGEIDYPSSNIVFALAKDDYDFENNNPWELKVVKPYNITNLGEVGQGFSLFRLERIL